MKSIIILLLVLIAILIGYIVYLRQSTIPKSDLEFVQQIADTRNNFIENEEVITFEEQLDQIRDVFLNSRDIAEALYAPDNPSKIDSATAKKYHDIYLKSHSYYSNPGSATTTNADSSRAVYLKLDKLIALSLFPPTSNPNYRNTAVYSYFIEYDSGGKSPYQRSSVIQMAIDQGAGKYPKVLKNEMWNFGDLCPPRCPENEQIKR